MDMLLSGREGRADDNADVGDCEFVTEIRYFRQL